MMRSLRSTLLLLAVVAGCSHHKKTTTSPDGGDDTDMARNTGSDAGGTCGILPTSGALQVVAPSGTTEELGRDVQIGLDRLGRPIIAYLDLPDGQPSSLYILRWDDCLGAFHPGVKIDDTIDSLSTPGTLSLSVDPSDGRIGVAYRKRVHIAQPPNANDTQSAFLAVSTDDGATFVPTRISKHKTETSNVEGDADDVGSVITVLANGKSYVAWTQNNDACGTSCATAATLATATGTGAFAQQVVPDSSDLDHGGYFAARDFPLGLAVDSGGVPAVVAHHEQDSAYTTVLAFWRNTDATFTQITDSATHQNDDGEAALAFDGLKPRVVSRLQQGDFGSIADYDLTLSHSDDSMGWFTEAVTASDHIQRSERIFAHAGTVTIAAGGPHVIRTTDFMNFDVTDESLGQQSSRVSSVLDANGKLWLAFEGTTPPSSQLGGVVLFHE